MYQQVQATTTTVQYDRHNIMCRLFSWRTTDLIDSDRHRHNQRLFNKFRRSIVAGVDGICSPQQCQTYENIMTLINKQLIVKPGKNTLTLSWICCFVKKNCPRFGLESSVHNNKDRRQWRNLKMQSSEPTEFVWPIKVIWINVHRNYSRNWANGKTLST